MNIKQDYIDSLAPNAAAITNAKGLKFLKLNVTEDETLLFGECAGSGKNPYTCSVDFIDRENPVARCSCPSRQFPCKHALGLLYAYAAGKPFDTEVLPEAIQLKRSKQEKRAENKVKKAEEAKTAKKEKSGKPSKAKITSAAKKIELQLEGVGVAELLLKNMLQTGIAGIDPAAIKQLEQQAKNLGNYYISGIQNAFLRLLINIREREEQDYTKAIESVLYMSALLGKAREHLESKRDNEERLLVLDTSSAIEEQIGHIWKLDELSEYGLCLPDVKLAQLAFYSYDDSSRRELVDEGFYACLNDGQIYIARNYRPYKALKYVKEEDSRFGLIRTPELYKYPGDLNPRTRWDKYTMETLHAEEMEVICASARTNYAEVIKSVKNQIKSPLSDKHPVVLLHVADMVSVKTDKGVNELHIVDENGQRQILRDSGYIEVPTVPILARFDKRLLIGSSLLVMYDNDIASGLLSAKPLSVVTKSGITRLIY